MEQLEVIRLGQRLALLGIVLPIAWLPMPEARGKDQLATRQTGFSVQAALDAQPGQAVRLPPGNHVLTEAIVIRHSGSSLFGPGRLIQTSLDAAFVEMYGAEDLSLRYVTMVRPKGVQDARVPAILARDCRSVTVEGVTILDTHSSAGAMRIERCKRVYIRHSQVRNYMTIAVDDRTNSPHYGYAFNCIDGTGIVISDSRDVFLEGNGIIEENLRPTPEMKKRHRLGEFVKRASKKGSLISQETWDAGYVNNWHQGSAIAVTGPETSAFVRLISNHVEYAAQGIDIHADFVTATGNIVVNSFIGMKAMHGSRHVLIANNQFIRNDLWSIGLMPGTAAHAASDARDGTPSQAANVDGGSVIANNIISEFGYGDSHWIWDPNRNTCAPILLDRGQEADDPPLRDVVVSGNVVYNTGRDKVLVDGRIRAEPPRYRYAVYVSGGTGAPQGLHFQGNLLHPGTEGLSNVELKP